MKSIKYTPYNRFFPEAKDFNPTIIGFSDYKKDVCKALKSAIDKLKTEYNFEDTYNLSQKLQDVITHNDSNLNISIYPANDDVFKVEFSMGERTFYTHVYVSAHPKFDIDDIKNKIISKCKDSIV